MYGAHQAVLYSDIIMDFYYYCYLLPNKLCRLQLQYLWKVVIKAQTKCIWLESHVPCYNYTS